MSKKHNISKSKFMQGIQCQKLLWMSVHNPEESAPVDEATQHLFDVGHRVGEYARKRFKGGVLIADDHEHIKEALESTEKHARNGAKALFEAAAAYNNVLCRADILKRVKDKKNLWDLYEVKSSSKLKKEHLPDIAIQRYCFEGAGYPIRKTFLMHLNNTYIRHGEINPKELLIADDVTDKVIELISDVKQKARDFLKMLSKDTCPDIEPGEHCNKPYDCPFYDVCHEDEEDYTIYEFPGRKKVIAALEAVGIKYLKDIPEDFPLSIKHNRQVVSNKTKKPVYAKKPIKEHLDKLVYPLYHFDFETIWGAIPLFDNTRPYQNFPFQFSLHIQNKPCGKCEHIEFLLKDTADPREKLIKAMLDNLGEKGSIVVYNDSFEKTRIIELARDFPAYTQKLNALIHRFWDLMIPFKTGDYMHYDFHGSYSIKYVLPALVPVLSYEDLEIQEGGTASLKAEKWYSGDMDKQEWEKNRQDLLEYCKLDTLAMVEILKVLYGAVE